MKIEATLEEIQTEYDWAEVFGEGGGGNCTQEVESLDGTPTDPVLRADIVSVIASVNGENDGDSWICIVLLKDGRLACLEGFCDYTGWDCQAGNTITVAKSLDSLITSGITPEWCLRLDIPHPNTKIDNMQSWTYVHQDGFLAVITADNIEMAKTLLRKELEQCNMGYVQLENVDLIPLPTHHRHIRKFEIQVEGRIKS